MIARELESLFFPKQHFLFPYAFLPVGLVGEVRGPKMGLLPWHILDECALVWGENCLRKAVLSACDGVCTSPHLSGCRLQGTIQPCWAICSPPVCLPPFMGTAEEEDRENGRDDFFPFWP